MKKIIKHFFKSVACACHGIRMVYSQESSFRIQTIIGIIIIGLAFYLGITGIEWLLILIVIGTVLAFEIFNSTVEKMLDFIHPDEDPKIKIIKDISAAAVLVTALMAIIIGLIIFIPYF